MIPGEILSENLGFADSIDAGADRVKIALIERHHATGHVGLAYLSGYGLKSGAIATSVSHDSHNIIAVGANESDMAFAVKRIQAMHGGIAVVENGAVRAEGAAADCRTRSAIRISKPSISSWRTRKPPRTGWALPAPSTRS